MVSVGTGCFTPPLKYNFQLYHPKWQKTKSQSLILLIQTDVYPLNQKSKDTDKTLNDIISHVFELIIITV